MKHHQKKGHEYITLFVDLEQRRVIDTQIGKDKSCIEKFVHTLEAKGGDRKQVEQVSIDMSPSFIGGTLEMLPNAQLTFDKFHLVQHLNKAMDETRKAERTGNDLLKGHKYTFLKNSSKLSRTKENQLNNISLHYPVLGEAYRLKEMFLI